MFKDRQALMQRVKERSTYIQIVDTALKQRKDLANYRPYRDDASAAQAELIEMIVEK